MGRVTSARVAERPGNRVRASTQASGIPNSSASPVAANAVVMLSRRASATIGSPSRSPRSVHGARCSSATKGTATKATATAARGTIARGASALAGVLLAAVAAGSCGPSKP